MKNKSDRDRLECQDRDREEEAARARAGGAALKQRPTPLMAVLTFGDEPKLRAKHLARLNTRRPKTPRPLILKSQKHSLSTTNHHLENPLHPPHHLELIPPARKTRGCLVRAPAEGDAGYVVCVLDYETARLEGMGEEGVVCGGFGCGGGGGRGRGGGGRVVEGEGWGWGGGEGVGDGDGMRGREGMGDAGAGGVF